MHGQITSKLRWSCAMSCWEVNGPAGTGGTENVQSRVDWTEAGSLCCVVYPSAFLTSCHHCMFVSILLPLSPLHHFALHILLSFCYASPAIRRVLFQFGSRKHTFVILTSPFLANFILRVQLPPSPLSVLASECRHLCRQRFMELPANSSITLQQHSRSSVRVNRGK